MQDSVAEVLRQRRRVPQPRAAGVAASIVLHVGVVALFIGYSRHAPANGLDRPVIVKLTSASSLQTGISNAARTPQKAPQPAPAAPKPPEAKQDLPQSREAEKPTVKESAFGRMTEKTPAEAGRQSAKPAVVPGQTSQESAVPSVPGSGTGSEGIQLGGPGVTSLEGGDFPYPVYIERMIALIGSQWFRPEMRGAGVARVYFRIERDGTLRDVEIRERSGNATFDRAALRAVIEASPLPPLPFGYRGSYLGVHLTFH